MRILYLCHRIPYPPNKGEKIRAYHQLEALGREHQVDLYTLADDPTDLGHRPALLKHCRTVSMGYVNPLLNRLRALPHLLTNTPLTVPCFHSATLHREVRQGLAKRSYDRIFVYSSSMMQYVEGVNGIPILMDLVDVDSNKWLQYAGFAHFPFSAVYRREARCLRNVERRICEKVQCVIVTTDREACLVREISPTANVHVIPNGVDTEHFYLPRNRPQPSSPGLIFTGDMSYYPNVEAVTYFARRVFPLVRDAVPTARFVIVGRDPGRSVQRLQRIPGVCVTGFVPDVRTYFQNAAIAVAPFSIAAGIQNKVLEAMACGLPVVGTTRAIQGLTPGVADMVEVGDSPEELARRIVNLLRHELFARRRGIESRDRLAADYDWRKNLDQLLALVREPSGFPTSSPKSGVDNDGAKRSVEGQLLSADLWTTGNET